MKKLLMVFLLLWGGTRAQAQPPFQDVNLVKDGSFEDTLTCPVHNGGITPWMGDILRYWGQETGSAIAGGAYNSCDHGFGHPPIVGVPQNKNGYEPAHSGNGYGSICTYLGPDCTVGGWSCAFGRLSQTLQAHKRYRVTCYVSRMDSCIYACNNFQVYFSDTVSWITSPEWAIPILNLTHPPEVVFHQDLKSKEGWTKLDTTFVAAGNERFITLGNFLSNAQSDAQYVGGNPVWTTAGYWLQDGPGPQLVLTTNWTWAGYFIDDVSVVLDDDTGLEGTGAGQVSVYPNPSTGSFSVRLTDPAPAALEITNLLGEQLFSANVAGTKEMELNTALAKGVYWCKITQGGKVVYQTKLIIQ